MARLIDHATLAAAPWKNGGGSTTDIALFPPGANYDDFDWRVSLATIDRSGPFSLFPGVDRTLLLVAGASVTLTISGAAPRLLDHDTPAASFAGEVAVHASIGAGRTTDFNVMTRRARCAHRVTRRPLDGTSHITRASTTTLLFLARGATLTAGGITLAPLDALLLDAADPATLAVCAAAPALLFVVDILEPMP